MALLGQPAVQLFAIGGDGFVGHHVAEVFNAIQFLSGLVQPLAHIVLQLLGHPDDPLDTALFEKLDADQRERLLDVLQGQIQSAATMSR